MFARCELSQSFQSTLSVRRATMLPPQYVTVTDISIHALREESDLLGRIHPARIAISIHALREESDSMARTSPTATSFQSTLSVRRATSRPSTKSVETSKFQSTLSVRRATFRPPSPACRS